MPCFAGLDVSLQLTSICIVDDSGAVVSEAKVPSEPEPLVSLLMQHAGELAKVGLEAGPLSQHLYSRLAEAGLPVVCVEARHMAQALRAQALNKTDRNDARGLAQMMRVGLYKPVHVKSDESQRLNVLLRTRKLLKSRLLDVEADLRGVLKNFGLKLGKVTPRDFSGRVRELASFDRFIARIVEPMLAARQATHVRSDAVCRRLMTMPGVGAVVALTFRVAIDSPTRFTRSRTVGAHLGLTPRRYQSADWPGRISKIGDPDLRAALYEAAVVHLTRVARPTALRSWAMRLAKRRGKRKPVVALARKMAVILHRMWADDTDFRWRAKTA
jgi:transposase